MDYQWSNYLLDAKRYRLLRDGKQVEVEPQVFDLLVYLIENRDRVVTRDELLNNLWKGRVVMDNTVNARLKGARKVVGDSGRQQATIKTIHGRGYQFIAQVVEVNEDEGLPSGGGQVNNVAGNNRSAPSIGVVRFSNLSNNPEQQYFSDGISTNVWAGLARIRSLIVKSALNYDHRDTSLKSIASTLEVDYLLTGSVQREADHVRVFVELIDSASGETKWSEKYDRIGARVIAIQDDIARAIIATLWTNVTGKIREAEFEQLSRKTTKDFNAYDFILKGIAAKEKYTRDGNLEAHYYFNQAKSLEPDSAEALAWSAIIHSMDVYLGFTDDFTHTRNQAFAEARRALSIDRNSEAGHWALAFCYGQDRQYDKALAEFDAALEINPNNPDALVCKGSHLALSGKVDEGIELCLEAIRFSRNYPVMYLWELGTAYFYGERFDDAIETFSKISEQNTDIRTYLAASYGIQGRLEEAARCLQEIFRSDPQYSLDRIPQAYGYLSGKSFANLQRGLEVAFNASTDQTVVQIERFGHTRPG
jgi:TolB-like protein/Tfp pilus assembly protein PilF